MTSSPDNPARPDAAPWRAPPMRAAIALAALWAIVVIAYAVGAFSLGPAGEAGLRAAPALDAALFLVAAAAPAAMILFACRLAVSAKSIEADLRRAVDRHAETASPPGLSDADRAALVDAVRASATPNADGAETARALASLEAALGALRAEVASARAAAPADPAPAPAPATEAGRVAETEKTTAGVQPLEGRDQPALPFGGDAGVEGGAGVPWSSVVRALDFPRDPGDREGFAALRAVVADKEFAELLQAAEDALTLLAEDGLYMEDLAPAAAPLSAWAAYAEGARGVEVSALAGVTADPVLSAARARMRADAVFRDAALHFLRRFDRLMGRMFRELGPDPLLAAVGDTRTGRAFMVIAKVAGVFDRGRGRMSVS